VFIYAVGKEGLIKIAAQETQKNGNLYSLFITEYINTNIYYFMLKSVIFVRFTFKVFLMTKLSHFS